LFNSGVDPEGFHDPSKGPVREAIPKLLSGAQKQILQRYMGLYGGSPSHHGFLGGGLEHEFYDFPYIGNVIIPTDELHHFSEGKGSATNQSL